MKVWKEFGSSHSGNVTVIGEFENEEAAEKALRVIEDFATASWEEKYPNVKAFIEAWKSQVPNLEYIPPTQSEFETGIDNEPSVYRDGRKVVVTDFRSENVGGFIKILFRLNMTNIQISGHGA